MSYTVRLTLRAMGPLIMFSEKPLPVMSDLTQCSRCNADMVIRYYIDLFIIVIQNACKSLLLQAH
jgi:hypothetical protein